MIYHQLTRRKEQLEKQLAHIRQQLETFPSKNLVCTRNGKYNKWYESDGENLIYIPKKERNRAELLASKKYLSCLYTDLLHEKKAIERHLKSVESNSSQVQKLIKNPAYKDLLSNVHMPSSPSQLEWMKEPYLKNPLHPENLTIETNLGLYVRSKSEALIAMVLSMHKLAFRYECALELGDLIYYPDFTILHPVSGRQIYYEHFGKMDDPYYAQNAFAKLHTYSNYGILPGIQLITTFESKKHPLSITTIEKALKTIL